MTKEELILRWFEELWGNGDESVIDELLAEECVAHGLGPEPVRGREGFRELYRGFRAAFPEASVEVERVVEKGDVIAFGAAATFRSGSGGGPYRFAGAGIARVEDGRMVEVWNYWDFLGLLTAMGRVPGDAMERALAAARGDGGPEPGERKTKPYLSQS